MLNVDFKKIMSTYSDDIEEFKVFTDFNAIF